MLCASVLTLHHQAADPLFQHERQGYHKDPQGQNGLNVHYNLYRLPMFTATLHPRRISFSTLNAFSAYVTTGPKCFEPSAWEFFITMLTSVTRRLPASSRIVSAAAKRHISVQVELYSSEHGGKALNWRRACCMAPLKQRKRVNWRSPSTRR
jgi:hypothetical protein